MLCHVSTVMMKVPLPYLLKLDLKDFVCAGGRAPQQCRLTTSIYRLVAPQTLYTNTYSWPLNFRDSCL